MKYIVYITFYSGNKLPPFYIGSSYEEKVNNGYNGSVKSKKYKEIYESEQKNNKHLFKTKILSYHTSRALALEEELRIQKLHLVVKNNRYYNESYAKPNGFFGRDTSGELNPGFGGPSKESREKQKNTKSSDEWKINNSGSNHPRCLENIHIYNEKDELIFISSGTFSEFCKKNNLPFGTFKTALKNGTRLYETSQALTKAKKNGNHIYKGWHIKHVL